MLSLRRRGNAGSGNTPERVSVIHRQHTWPEQARISDAEITELLQSHYDFQKGAFISEWQEHNGCIRVFSEISPLPMWNHLAAFQRGSDAVQQVLQDARRSWPKSDRPPVVYLLDPPPSAPNKENEAPDGYQRCDRESWMIYTAAGQPHFAASDLQIHCVTDDAHLADFIEVFAAAFRAKGNRYANAFKSPPLKTSSPARTKHFVAYADGQPVCTGTLSWRNELACIYNVATRPQVRQRGFAAHIAARLIAHAQACGCSRIFLQEESGGAAERLYTRMGFVVAFT